MKNTVIEDFRDGDWLFTCRHTYEDELCSQLLNRGVAAQVALSGLVRVPLKSLVGLEDPLTVTDVSYALQVMPEVTLAHGVSVKRLAYAIADQLAAFVDGVQEPWSIHVIVPGQLRGNPKPPMKRRAVLLLSAVVDRLTQIRRRAMRHYQQQCEAPTRLVQLFVCDLETVAVSVARPRTTEVGGLWPSAMPAGLADVQDDSAAPASSYRKLEEALACMNSRPERGEHGVDVGACPGGWSQVLLRYGASVDAVDRQPLAAHLVRHKRLRFFRADAFDWSPDTPVDWWVSDVVAYPDRILEMVARVSEEIRPRFAVIQMKFRGPPDHDAVRDALTSLRQAGYGARARHFFNDKNEVTLMAVLR